MKKKSPKEILDYVIAKIQEQGGRAITTSYLGFERCVYQTEEGKRCAHSLCVKDNIAKEISTTLKPASALIEEQGDNCHKPEYRGYPVKFWMEVQQLHDQDEYWYNELTLSEVGKEHYNYIITRFTTQTK